MKIHPTEADLLLGLPNSINSAFRPKVIKGSVVSSALPQATLGLSSLGMSNIRH
jgi:hypothetical protein